MRKELMIALGGLALLSSFTVWARAGEPASPSLGQPPEPALFAKGSAAERAAAAGTAASATAALTNDLGGVLAPLGFTYRPVSQDLVAQLGSESAQGVVVLSVQEGAAAQEAGLQALDVLLEIDGQPANAQLASEAGPEGATLELRVIRAGVLRTVTLGEFGSGDASSIESTSEFLSSGDLLADHPFRRAKVWEELRDSYSEDAEHYSDLAQAAKDKRRKAREEAKEAAKLLRAQAAAEVQTAFDRYETELLAWVDEVLSAEASAGLANLSIDSKELVEEEVALALDQQLGEMASVFVATVSEQPVLREGSEKEIEQARKGLHRIAEEAERLHTERVAKVWHNTLRALTNRHEGLGPQTVERAAWCTEKVKGIRANLHERITCAFDRAAEELDKQLARRLQDLDVPVPGELEMAVDEIYAQVDRMASNFLDQTTAALARYGDDVSECNSRLRVDFSTHLSHWAADVPRLQAEFEADTARDIGTQPLSLGDGWRSRTQLNRISGDLRGTWRSSVTDARDAMRTSIGALPRSLDEHQVACEDAWRDVRELLGTLHSNSNNNCWKLDGPYLDGRFPGGESLEGDVAIVID